MTATSTANLTAKSRRSIRVCQQLIVYWRQNIQDVLNFTLISALKSTGNPTLKCQMTWRLVQLFRTNRWVNLLVLRCLFQIRMRTYNTNIRLRYKCRPVVFLTENLLSFLAFVTETIAILHCSRWYDNRNMNLWATRHGFIWAYRNVM